MPPNSGAVLLVEIGNVFYGNDGKHSATWTDVLTTIIGTVWLCWMWMSLYAAEKWTGESDEAHKEFSKPPPDAPDE